MYFLYSLVTAAAMLLLSPYFLLRGLRSGKYVHNVRQRLGYLPADFPRSPSREARGIWVHAVSVGGLTSQLRRAAASVPTNIAEGFSR